LSKNNSLVGEIGGINSFLFDNALLFSSFFFYSS